ncbi:SDR family oxidoreductase [Engelhardtia mirabilis]|uniref:dTDP-4-dehydrorhamnose reductase n=1 Tax=Engelhardtia mirabilis TaxID=2528011 RepID=A0A518BPU6_9BACT|nr:dTDP-4-dehydrorhamnose reductase [Planctomycetes bacterium Pla133]QDV03313.1 dTDP-4-dehydrorhamnose reductase [Planctomycetes bacterium Pla86]
MDQVADSLRGDGALGSGGGSADRRVVLVLGASGFLGPHVLERAAARPGWTVAAGARDPRRSCPPLTGVAFEPVAIDLASCAAISSALERCAPTHVLNLAAIASQGVCEAQPELANRINAAAPGEIAAWCQGHGARLLHVSTDLVFGAEPAPPGGFDEDALPAPVSVYGQSKWAGERAVLDACPAALVVRLPLLFGDSRGRGLGATDGLLAALARGPFTLFKDEWRTPLEVGAAAAALVELVAGDARGILHVAGPERVSRLDLGLAALAAVGSAAGDLEPPRASLRADAGAADRPGDTSLDARRAAALLSFELPGLQAGIDRWATDRGFAPD